MDSHTDGEEAVGITAHQHGPGPWMHGKTHCSRTQCEGWCRQDCCRGSGLGHARRLRQQRMLPKVGLILQRTGHLASSDMLA